MEALMVACVAFLGVAVTVVISTIFSGYALSVLWGWFIAPVFHLPQLSIPVAIGLALVVGFMTKQVNWNDGDEKGYKELVCSLVKPAFALLIGWIVKQYI